MTGWIVAVVFLLAGAAVSLLLLRSLRREHALLQKFLDEDKLRAARRRRVFEVLEVLGNALQAGQPDTTMHRLIAEGAVKVVESEGAALYLFDERTKLLVPKHYTKDCPPLIALPERIVEQARTNAGTLPSFLRLHSIKPGEGVLGYVFQTLQEENVPDLRHHAKFDGGANPFQQHIFALVAPLKHGTRGLGVLVAARERTTAFSQHELEMFDSLAEQCGFALGNAQAHQEAGAKRALESELKNASEIQRILLPEKAPDTPAVRAGRAEHPGETRQRRLLSTIVPVDEHTRGRRHRGRLRQGHPRRPHHGHVPQRAPVQGPGRTFSPADVLAAVNRNLFPDIREDMFITVSYAVFAGGWQQRHPRPAPAIPSAHLAKGKRAWWKCPAPGVAVGVDKGSVFERVTKDVPRDEQRGRAALFHGWRE